MLKVPSLAWSHWPAAEVSAGLYAFQGRIWFLAIYLIKARACSVPHFLTVPLGFFSSSSLFCIWEPHDWAGHIWKIEDDFPHFKVTCWQLSYSVNIRSPLQCDRTHLQNPRIMASWWASFCQTMATQWYLFNMLATCPNSLDPCWVKLHPPPAFSRDEAVVTALPILTTPFCCWESLPPSSKWSLICPSLRAFFLP